MIKTEA